MAGYKEPRGENIWLLVVSAGFDAAGKRIKHTKTFKGTPKQADKALALFVADVERNEYEKPTKLIVRDLFRKWLDGYGKFNLKPTTYAGFERYLIKRAAVAEIGENNISFGAILVNKLAASDFYALYTYLRVKYKYSNKTLLQIHRIMHSAFKEAMSWTELQMHYHPMLGVKAPVPAEKPIVRIKDKEVIAFLNAALKHAPFWFFVYLAIDFTVGPRRGEICGLRYMDILHDINKVSIWQNFVRVKDKGLIIETPKSGKPRIVSAPQDIIDLIRIYRQRVESEKGPQPDNALLFQHPSGGPVSPDEVSHYMKSFREQYNLPNVTIHGGRHSNAAILINRGASLKEVSEHLGHSTTQITDITYTEVWEEKKKGVADLMNGLIPKLDQPEPEPIKSNVIQFRKKA